MKRIGVWLPEKKSQKLNWKELIRECNAHGYEIVKLDLNIPLEDQGPLDVFLHKLTDLLTSVLQGDVKNKCLINDIEQFLSNHPEVTVVDPLDNVRILLERHRTYSIIENEPTFKNKGIFTPNFASFTTTNHERNMEIVRQRSVTFPLICKSSMSHGSKSAHEMVLISNERGLKVCKPPCVVQSFVNHNAIFYKVFIVGNRYHICERPSLKNFYPSEEAEPIFYSTGEVCKANSQSTLSILDPADQPQADIKMNLDETKVRHIIYVLKREIGLSLFGFDVVIDNISGKHAVIDVNVFPSNDSFPNFFGNLLDCIDDSVSRNRNRSDKNRSDSDRNKREKNANNESDKDNSEIRDKMSILVNAGSSSVKMGVSGAYIIN